MEVWDAAEFWIQSLSTGRLLTVKGAKASTTNSIRRSKSDLEVIWKRQIVAPSKYVYGFPPRPQRFRIRLFHPGSGSYLCVPTSNVPPISNREKPIIEVLALSPEAMRVGEMEGRVTCHLSEKI